MHHTQAADSPPGVGGAILELTSGWLRLGLPGAAAPGVEIPTVVGKTGTVLLENSNSLFPIDYSEVHHDLELVNPISWECGKLVFEEPSIVLELLQFALVGSGSTHLCPGSTPLRELPLLLVEPAATDPEFRQLMCEILFENLDCRSVYFARHPTLAAFACARTSATIFDVGSSGATAAIVADGCLVKASVASTAVGGNLLSRKLADSLHKSHINIVPPFATSSSVRPHYVSDSLWEAGVSATIDKVKALLCGFDVPSNSKVDLPDGTSITLDSRTATNIPSILLNGYERLAYQGLGDFVSDAVSRSLYPLGKNRDPLRTLVLTGGSVGFRGFSNAVERGVQFDRSVFAAPPVTVIGSNPRLTPFIGASIVASLGSFGAFCVAREQVFESGVAAIDKACP